ncbi:SMP-30/gluconolactonase/LRE family protein [Halobacillus yeomjeoni]|uniref:SMP-30/gluconolactonase/LRE family protein n=1 Tax=Halobacillus yeomjeoni TaxID=311194 RepID=UPI001CD35C19|nr:SMP-30/gluconolactonase/LRE family protein [Halobacillus yeomjeoni]MCA0984183.1 SMP-30/gluconolactonase/LRE family protein [Halobacillus yeomjeoni]
MTVKLVINSKSRLGESPSWDAEKELLYWVDIQGKKIHRYDPMKHENHTVELDQSPGTIVPREEGEVVLALENGFYFYNWISEHLDPIDDPEEHLPNNRFNDGKCDPAGRFWAGTTDEDGIEPNGALYCLDTYLNVEEKVSGVRTSNGLAWSNDFSSMYFIDTPTQQVVRYSYNIETGEITDPEVILSFNKEEGIPDGMTIDEEGMLWIAHWGGAKVSRWDPMNGEKIEEIHVPAVNVTSCVFGGKHRDELFITTARVGTSNEDLEKYPHAGGLFKVKTKVKGSLSYPFKG